MKFITILQWSKRCHRCVLKIATQFYILGPQESIGDENEQERALVDLSFFLNAIDDGDKMSDGCGILFRLTNI